MSVANEQVSRYCKSSGVYKQEDPWHGSRKIIGTHLKHWCLDTQGSHFVSCISSQPSHTALVWGFCFSHTWTLDLIDERVIFLHSVCSDPFYRLLEKKFTEWGMFLKTKG